MCVFFPFGVFFFFCMVWVSCFWWWWVLYFGWFVSFIRSGFFLFLAVCWLFGWWSWLLGCVLVRFWLFLSCESESCLLSSLCHSCLLLLALWFKPTLSLLRLGFFWTCCCNNPVALRLYLWPWSSGACWNALLLSPNRIWLVSCCCLNMLLSITISCCCLNMPWCFWWLLFLLLFYCCFYASLEGTYSEYSLTFHYSVPAYCCCDGVLLAITEWCWCLLLLLDWFTMFPGTENSNSAWYSKWYRSQSPAYNASILSCF